MAKNTVKTGKPKVKPDQYLKYYVLLSALAFAVYANCLSNEFVFDDESVVQGDQSLTSLSNIPKYFTGQEGFHKVIGRYYRPVVSASYNIDYAIWGLKPFGFHFTNILIHLINTILVFKLLMLLFKNSQFKYKDYLILFGAAVFAIHPIHTEAIAWVSGRTDSLFFTFFAAAFIYYLKYTEKPDGKNLAYMLLYYLLSLLGKEMAITFPVVVILYELIINKKTVSSFLKDKTVFLSIIILSFGYLLLRWYILKDVPERTSYNYFYGKDIATGIYTMLQTIPLYFRLDFLPFGMLYHYSGYMPYISSPANAAVIFALVFIAVMAGAAFYLKNRMPWVSFSILFIFLTLLPVVNIIPTMNFMADRFLYLPSLAVSFIVISITIKYFTPNRANIFYSAAILLTAAYLFLTVSRNADWKNNDTLFMSADGKPGTITYVNIGNIYANKQEYDKAEPYYRKALDIRSEIVLANVNLGKVFLIKGQFDSANYYIYKAYTLDTLSPEPMYSLALMYANNNKPEDAVKWLEKIQTVSPGGYMNSMQMLEQLKLTSQNKPNLQQNNSQMPNDLSSNEKQNLKSQILVLESESYKHYQEKDYAKAVDELTKLIRLNPSNAFSYNNNMGMCYLDQNKLTEAKKYFQASIDANKTFGTAYNNLASVYKKEGNNKKAKEIYEQTLKVDSNNTEAKKNLQELGK